jgi:hypothetical protein
MADDSGGAPNIPANTNWSEWTFEQALAAVTGEGDDLHAAATADWFDFNSGGGEGDSVSYHAFGHYYFAVNYNQDAMNKWQQAVSTIDGMMGDVAKGKRGAMDLQSLRDLEMAIKVMAVWADGISRDLQSWSDSVGTDDSAFRGKAAYLIHWRLKANADGLVDTHEQLTTRHGQPIADAVRAAGDALQTFNSTLASTWSGVTGLRDTVIDHLNYEVNSVMDYINAQGIVKGQPNYVLDVMDTDEAKAYISAAMAGYPLGDLSSQATWSAINHKVTQDVTAILKGWLDPPAQSAIAALQPTYAMASSALVEITAPPQENMPKPAEPDAGAGGDGDLKPPGADGGLPDPGAGADGGGDLTPPGADGTGTGAGMPDPGGAGDFSPPGADGTGTGAGLPGAGDFSPPGADGTGTGAGLPGAGDFSVPGADGTGTGAGLPGAGDFSPPGADGTGAGLPGADGGGAFIPPGAGFVPGLTNPGAGAADGSGRSGAAGPGADGAFDEPGADGALNGPGGADAGLNPPTGDLTVPSGVDTSGTTLPGGVGGDSSVHLPGAGGDSGDGRLTVPGGDAGKGFGTNPGSPFRIGESGAGSPSGVGLGAGGLGGGGLGGSGAGGFGTSGAGGFGGTPGTGGSVPTTAQASGPALPGVPGAPGAASDGSGGVPFFPPMMGGGAGMGGGGERPQERERQTWLAEDEEVWGTAVDIGPGVIGRVEEEYAEVERVPLARPTRGPRRAETPRRRRDAEQGTEVTGEEATTST